MLEEVVMGLSYRPLISLHLGLGCQEHLLWLSMFDLLLLLSFNKTPTPGQMNPLLTPLTPL